MFFYFFFFSSRRRHTRFDCDWSSDVCSSDLHWWIGVSVHDLEEAGAAQAAGADYLLVGPVYATATHPDRAPLAPEDLAVIVALGLPVIAIGGGAPGRTGEHTAELPPQAKHLLRLLLVKKKKN